MTTNIAPLPSGEIDNNSVEGAILADAPIGVVIAPEDALRAGAYRLIGRLLRMAPERRMLNQLSTHHVPERPGEDEVAVALRLLGLAASSTTPESADDEFHQLFIGVGRGELVPFGSWYQTGFLMEKPLSVLRDDLARLGFERREQVYESEDHVAALCEVMAMLIENGADYDTQQHFYNDHLGPWVGRFFEDLQKAQSACFYRAVGRFGAAFCTLENWVLNLSV
jgi:TorA maturation chaperone TorD